MTSLEHEQTMAVSERDPLDVWCPYCAASPGRDCRTRGLSTLRVGVGPAMGVHADRRRVAQGRLPELVPREMALRDALLFLNDCRRAFREAGEPEPPYWQATNALLMEVARREGRSVGDVAAEFRTERA